MLGCWAIALPSTGQTVPQLSVSNRQLELLFWTARPDSLLCLVLGKNSAP